MTTRIINGRRYDTEKAEEIYVSSSWVGPGDNCFETVRLMKTNKGAWFQYYPDRDPECIAPVSADEVFGEMMEEAERHDDAVEVLEKNFREKYQAIVDA